MSQFDIGTSGQGYSGGIASSLHKTVADTTKFNALLEQAKGEKYNTRLLEQLASEGPQVAGKNLEALVKAGTVKSYVTGINADFGSLQTQANATASFDANLQFGAQLAQQQAVVVALTKQANSTRVAELKEIQLVRKQLQQLNAQLVTAARRK